jgi:hypothetical protein
MDSTAQKASTRDKYPWVLALCALAILLIGWTVRPKEPAQTKAPAPEVTASQMEVEQLRSSIERNSLQGLSGQFSEAARAIEPFVVRLNELQRTGIIYSQETVLTAGPVTPQRPAEVHSANLKSAMMPVVWSPGIKLQGLHSAAKLPDAPSVAFGWKPQPGAWVLAAARRRNGSFFFVPGAYVGASSQECSGATRAVVDTNIPLDAAAEGGGIFDMNGTLLGLVVQCPEGTLALSMDEVLRILDGYTSPERALVQVAGIYAVQPTAAWLALFPAAKGVLVTDVWTGWPADAAGVEAGDVISLADGAEVSTAAQLSAALSATGMHKLRVERQGRALEIAYSGGASGGPPGISLATKSRLPLQIAENSAAFAAGLRSGDELLRVNGRPATAASVALLEKRTHPVWVVVQRDGRKIALVLPA